MLLHVCEFCLSLHLHCCVTLQCKHIVAIAAEITTSYAQLAISIQWHSATHNAELLPFVCWFVVNLGCSALLRAFAVLACGCAGAKVVTQPKTK